MVYLKQLHFKATLQVKNVCTCEVAGVRSRVNFIIVCQLRVEEE